MVCSSLLLSYEKKGYMAEWDIELELIRVIMESEPPDGNDYNDALNGRYSFWRWREWIICLGVVKAYEEMGHKAAIALSRNMTTYDLPDCFTEKPTPLLSRWLHREGLTMKKKYLVKKKIKK